jgi:stage II sporulation protein D
VVIRGDQFRAVVTRTFGARALASTRFSVRRDQNELVFTGRGFGHGVGLCQAGAVRLAGDGQSVVEILSHYFPGTRLRRLE